MPTHTQGVVEIKGEPSSKSLGKRDDLTLRAAFPGSPLLEMKDDEIKADFEERCLNGTVNDAGHTFGTQNLDYVDAPDLNEVETGPGGLPASPYVPNPTSPGEGSVDPSDLPSPPDGYGTTPSATPFIGVGALENPKGTSERQARHTLGDYALGKSSS